MNIKKYIFIFSGAFFLIIEAILFFYMHQKYLLMQKEVKLTTATRSKMPQLEEYFWEKNLFQLF